MTADRQLVEVERVKRSANGVISDPVTLNPEAKVGVARELMSEKNISGVPIVTSDSKLCGILTRRDLRFIEEDDIPDRDVMTKDNLITAPSETTLKEAEILLTRNKVEKLLLVDKQGKLGGLITIKDIDKLHRFPNACRDTFGPAASWGRRSESCGF